MQRGILLLITPIILLVGCGKHEVRDPMEFTLPEATARQELTLAKDILYKAHPSINLYKSKERVDFLFDSIYQTFTQRTSLRKFYNSLYFITNEFGCSHTDLFMPPSFYDTLRNRNYFFPFPVLWVGNKMLVNIADFDTPQGTEIVSINGQPVKQLLKEISLYNSVEGIHRPTQLSLACRDFSFQYYLKFGPQKKFNLQIIDTSGKAKTLSLDPINYSEWETRNSSYIYYFDGTAVDYDFILNNEKGYGLIRIPTFEFGNGQKQSAFEHFCSNTFELLQKKANIKTLIIDLRENTGGKLYAAFLLFSYLAKKPFTEYERVISKVNSLPYSSYLDKDFAEREKAGLETSLRDEFEKRKTGPYYYYDSSFINKWEPDKYRFDGNVFIITNPKTMSAASYFALLVKKTGVGKIVGEETAGGSFSGNGFTNLEYVLPASGIKLMFPYAHMIYSYKEEKNTGRGIIPDYIVPDTYESFKNNEDKQLVYIADSLILN